MASATQQEMIAQLRERGIVDPRVLAAMAAVPREQFVTPATLDEAYADRALPLTEGQTISQPYIVAVMAQAMRIAPRAHVLEIGTGSGYAAAVLACLAARVTTVERLAPLAATARARLAALGIANVDVHEGDGSLGWPADAPFDAIAVTAAGPRVPVALVEQLAVGGSLVMPVGEHEQELMRVIKISAVRVESERLGAVAFVPLIGEQAWPAPRR